MSIPDDQHLKRGIEDAAKKVAIEFRLPWRLSDLRECGRDGVRKAKRSYDQRLGASFPRYAWRHVYDAARGGGESMRVQEDNKNAIKTPPSEGCIRDALETFSKKEWTSLIAEFGREDLDPLRDYLDTNRDELERSSNWKSKYQGVLARAIQRNLILILSHPNLRVTDVTGPMWAATWRLQSRVNSVRGSPRPSRPRTWMEMSSDRAIAEALSLPGHKVERRQVKKWFERMEQEALEEFEGNAYEYYLKMSDPEAYKRHREHLRRAGKRDEE